MPCSQSPSPSRSRRPCQPQPSSPLARSLVAAAHRQSIKRPGTSYESRRVPCPSQQCLVMRAIHHATESPPFLSTMSCPVLSPIAASFPLYVWGQQSQAQPAFPSDCLLDWFFCDPCVEFQSHFVQEDEKLVLLHGKVWIHFVLPPFLLRTMSVGQLPLSRGASHVKWNYRRRAPRRFLKLEMSCRGLQMQTQLRCKVSHSTDGQASYCLLQRPPGGFGSWAGGPEVPCRAVRWFGRLPRPGLWLSEGLLYQYRHSVHCANASLVMLCE
ncbi:hypothetical protein J3F83DRAFT_741996 [Trichoderma novae-zelandiae]